MWGCFVALLDKARHFVLCNVRLVSAFVPGTPFRIFPVTALSSRIEGLAFCQTFRFVQRSS